MLSRAKNGDNIAVMSTAAKLSLFLADRTNGRTYATVLRLSVVCLSVCDVMYCG